MSSVANWLKYTHQAILASKAFQELKWALQVSRFRRNRWREVSWGTIPPWCILMRKYPQENCNSLIEAIFLELDTILWIHIRCMEGEIWSHELTRNQLISQHSLRKSIHFLVSDHDGKSHVYAYKLEHLRFSKELSLLWTLGVTLCLLF